MKTSPTKKKPPVKPTILGTSKDTKFRSGLERNLAADLDKKCTDYTYEQERIPYFVERKYVADFILPNGIIVEAKGWFKSADQRKMRNLKEQHPDREFRFVFQRLNSKVQGSTMTCADWCEKYGFLYAETFVPKEWVNEKD
jgi:hypothetical protein|tara:strand:- start:16088 stop:16510 length:423 start_codon:yes stop_codon:yes gene_type:complete